MRPEAVHLIVATTAGLIAGGVCGLLPLGLAISKGRLGLGILALPLCIIAGGILGIILAVPVALALSGVIFAVSETTQPRPGVLGIRPGQVPPIAAPPHDPAHRPPT